MTAVIQRIRSANVTADGIPTGKAQKGLLVMLGVRSEDTEDICDRMAEKLAKMRIFEGENGKLDFSPMDINADILLISNFTLCASCRRGNRPDFSSAERPERAKMLYERFCNKLISLGLNTETGVFGVDMQISAELDGPVTIVLDSDRDLAK